MKDSPTSFAYPSSRTGVSRKRSSSALADALDAPPPSRPWYRSKLVLLIVGITTLFVAAHVLLLARVLSRVHNFDAQILLLPFLGLSASAIVAAFAVGVNRLSDPKSEKRD